MRQELFALFGILIGGAATMMARVLPLAYPDTPWRTLFWGSLTVVVFSFLFLIYALFIKPRMAKEVKLIPLIMIISGILLIAGGAIYHLSDKNLDDKKGISTTSPPATEPPKLYGLSFFQKRIDSTDPIMRYQLDVEIQTDYKIEAPIALVLTCAGYISRGEVDFIGIHHDKVIGRYEGQSNQFLISWSSPPFIPQEKIMVRLFSTKTPLKVLKVEEIAWHQNLQVSE